MSFDGPVADYEGLVKAIGRGDALSFNDEMTGNRITYSPTAIDIIKYEADHPVPPPVPARKITDNPQA